MISEWFLAFRDKELLFAKLLELADAIQDKGAEAIPFAKKKLRAVTEHFANLRKWFFWALIWTGILGIVWIILWFCGVSSTWPFQVLCLLIGLPWAAYLFYAFFVLAAIELLLKVVPGAMKVVRDALRVPAAVALITLMLAIVVGRFPALLRPDAIVSLLLIMAGLGLASFLGWFCIKPEWLKKFVGASLLFALLSLLFAPKIENIIAAIGHRAEVNERRIAGELGVHLERVSIDLDRPPQFFRSEGKTRNIYWYSRTKDGGYELWDGSGFHPDTNEELKPVDTKEKRDAILASLRANIAKSKREQDAEIARKEDVRRREEQEQRERDQAGAIKAEVRKMEEDFHNRNQAEAKARALFRSSIFLEGATTNSPSAIDVAFVANLSPFISLKLDKILKEWSSNHAGVSEKNVFATTFRDTPHFKALFARDGTSLKEAHAEEIVDIVVAISEHISSAPSPRNPAVEIAEIKLDFVAWDARRVTLLKSFSISSTGSGFARTAAISEAANQAVTILQKRLEEELTPCLKP